MEKHLADYAFDRLREIDYNTYRETCHFEEINDNEFLLILSDKSCFIFDTYHERICEYDAISKHTPPNLEDDGDAFSMNLLQRMNMQEMTPIVLADATNIRLDKVYDFTEGRRLPKYKELIRLAKELRCSITDLTLKH